MRVQQFSNPNQEALRGFDDLPDSAYVRVPVVAALRGCTVNTVWRHAKQGLLPAPKKIGPMVTGWNVGELRLAMGQKVAE
jgi:prophage regulatory protein